MKFGPPHPLFAMLLGFPGSSGAGGGGPAVPVNTVAPVVSPTTVEEGDVVSCTTGSWTNTPTSYSLQWKADGVNISGATSSTYTPGGTQVGAALTCTVTAHNATGDSTPALSNATSAVTANPYTYTGFVSSGGDDGTALLNKVSLPFASLDACVTALEAAYGAHATSIRLLSDITGGLAYSTDLDTLLTAGLTIKSHDASVRTITGTVSFGGAAAALLTLEKVVLDLTKVAHIGATAVSAGTITGDADTTIGTLTLDADFSTTAGSAGSAGPTVVGSPNGAGQPAPASPPTPGTNGGDANADGGTGTDGSAGNRAWNLTLVLAGVVSALFGRGGDGGHAAAGGAGGSATGGDGGGGGDSDSVVLEDGGVGGNGGNATANGGNASLAGTGGDGSNVFFSGGGTITSQYLDAGIGGFAALGGAAGSATAGNGGSGGAGASGGSTGADGSPGTATAIAGADSIAGTDGTSGSII